MATEPHSAKKSVALFTSKPMVFLNAATIRPTTIALDRLFFRLERLFIKRMLVCCSSPPSRRGSRSNLIICSQSDHRISGLVCDTLRDQVRVLPEKSANLQDSKNQWFCLQRRRDLCNSLACLKNYFLDGLTCSPRPVQGLLMTN